MSLLMYIRQVYFFSSLAAKIVSLKPIFLKRDAVPSQCVSRSSSTPKERLYLQRLYSARTYAFILRVCLFFSKHTLSTTLRQLQFPQYIYSTAARYMHLTAH